MNIFSIYSFQVYTGREVGIEHVLEHRVVKDFVRPYHDTGMRVYMDNFETRVSLLRKLASFGIGGYGNVRANRKFSPVDLFPKRVQLAGEPPIQKYPSRQPDILCLAGHKGSLCPVELS
ncbi:hypothetical protein ElyMa_000503800 [Elysia marginata]|uniref:PiggyBac transposable element-derived protein domain-containing protein n=1 Tax=Elysia marginata TaxID=1093978 RepID=A0AAV4FVF3_9GAST|nr:hypothetical protein ElyMa_000503800 [Elysia marginata]